MQRQTMNMKKKTARVQSEMEDLKLLLEEEQSRNAELEKKQRRLEHSVVFCHFYKTNKNTGRPLAKSAKNQDQSVLFCRKLISKNRVFLSNET